MKKFCNKCGVAKSIEDFNKDSAASNGIRGYCRDCGKVYWKEHTRKNREKRNARAKELRGLNVLKYRQQVRKSELKVKYGLTPENFNRLRAEQKDCCACCGDKFLKTPHVDHIHGSNPVVIRGLLCTGCNTGLGQFKDSFSRLLKAASYLRKFTSYS